MGEDHHPLVVAAVRDRAGDEAEDEVGQRLERTHDAHRESRAGQRQDEQRQGGEAHGIAERGDTLGDTEGPEVAVLRERDRGRSGRDEIVERRGGRRGRVVGRREVARHRCHDAGSPRNAGAEPGFGPREWRNAS
jgi:hypothetical protein